MDINKLVIGDLFIANERVVIGVTFKNIKSKEESAKMDISIFIDLWKGKPPLPPVCNWWRFE
jgi:hypothetical protein